MRWKAEDRPKVQERRIITKFLLFPKTLKTSDGDRYVRWLEHGDILQIYDNDIIGWVNIQWNDL